MGGPQMSAKDHSWGGLPWKILQGLHYTENTVFLQRKGLLREQSLLLRAVCPPNCIQIKSWKFSRVNINGTKNVFKFSPVTRFV